MASLGKSTEPVDCSDGTATLCVAKRPQSPTSASGSTVGTTSSAESACGVSEFEDSEDNSCLQYPPAWCVKNTFVDVLGDLSLTPVRSLRRTASAPPTSFGGTTAGAEDGGSITYEGEEDEAMDGEEQLLFRSSTSIDLEDTLKFTPWDEDFSGNGIAPPPPPWTPSLAPVDVLMPLPPPPETTPSWPHAVATANTGTYCTTEAPAVLRLADHLLGDGEQMVSAEISEAATTLGSVTHPDQCKPCAFVWREVGCENGASCLFCHLCGPSERRRRKKERQHSSGTGRQARRRSQPEILADPS